MQIFPSRNQPKGCLYVPASTLGFSLDEYVIRYINVYPRTLIQVKKSYIIMLLHTVNHSLHLSCMPFKGSDNTSTLLQ